MSVVDIGIETETSDDEHSVGYMHFRINKESLSGKPDYSNLKLIFTIIDSNNQQIEVEGAPISFEFGSDYRYKLVNEAGAYFLLEVDY